MVAQKYRWDFVGLSTDVKPTPATSDKVVDGSTFYCSDTSKLYVYCKNNWYERKALGGGGGGTTYTAGDGIDITDDTISVDTDTIQEKLTAGDNITISDNVISATGGGGGGVTPVQTTGTSTTDVMSQDATTKMIYPDIANNPYKMVIGEGLIDGTNKGLVINGVINTGLNSNSVAIGVTDGSTARIGQHGRANASVAIGADASVGGGKESVSIGSNAYCNSGQDDGDNVAIGHNSYAGNNNVTGTVALGARSKPTRQGEVNVGNTANQGFNNTAYRVIGGVHDGQTAHDCLTVGQANALIDAINSALNTNIPHIGS